MDSLSKELLQHEPIGYKSLTGTGKSQIGFDEVPVDAAAKYAAEDAVSPNSSVISKRQDSKAVSGIFIETWSSLVSVLSRMECKGIKIDSAALSEMSKEFHTN